MLKFQMILIAVLVCCFAFVSCDRAQQIMTPVTMDGSDSEKMTDPDMTDPDMTDPDMTDPDMKDPDMADPDMGNDA